MSYAQRTVAALLDDLAAGRPAPAAGTAIAFVAASAAALTAMAGRAGDPDGATDVVARAEACRARAAGLADADADAYGTVVTARRSATDDDDGVTLRAAIEVATDVPLEIAAVAREVVELAAPLVTGGPVSLRGDAHAAVSLAVAATAAASRLVRINTVAGGLADDRATLADRWSCEAVAIAGALDRDPR